MAPKTSSATLRLKQDYVRLKNDPVPYVVAEPVPSNILEWYVFYFFFKSVLTGQFTIGLTKPISVIQVLCGQRT